MTTQLMERTVRPDTGDRQDDDHAGMNLGGTDETSGRAPWWMPTLLHGLITGQRTGC